MRPGQQLFFCRKPIPGIHPVDASGHVMAIVWRAAAAACDVVEQAIMIPLRRRIEGETPPL